MKNTKIEHCTQTGLIFIKDIPFTIEAARALIAAFEQLNKLNPRQFTTGIAIGDQAQGTEAMFNRADALKLESWLEDNALNKFAQDKDFN